MLAVSISIGILVILLFFMVGGIIGYLMNRHFIENGVPDLHPEFFDEYGRVITGDLLTVNFEQYDDDEEEEEYSDEIGH